MTFDELWPHLLIPGEFDSMDECDQERWRGALRQAWQAGVDETARRCAEVVTGCFTPAKEVKTTKLLNGIGFERTIKEIGAANELIKQEYPEAFK